MPATPAWLAVVEAALNRWIGESARAGAHARRLEGTALQINVQGLTAVRLGVWHGRLALTATGNLMAGSKTIADATTANAAIADATLADTNIADASVADATIANATVSGSPFALLRMLRGSARAGDGPHRGAPKAAPQIRGDAEVANLYRELLSLARPDLEEEISRILGDLAARRLSQFAKRTLSWARHARRAAGENLAEYWQEESRDLVNKTELDEFLHGVDALRETADRIEARLARLERRWKATP
jgi:ubiquinone biosynthesis protein UbiJ